MYKCVHVCNGVCLLCEQTLKLKAEARLNLLREVGVIVDTWLKSAMNQVMEELENERWATLNTHDASLSVSHSRLNTHWTVSTAAHS